MKNNKIFLLVLILFFSSQMRAEHFYRFYFHTIDTSNYPIIRVKGVVYLEDAARPDLSELSYMTEKSQIIENGMDKLFTPFQVINQERKGNYIFFELFYVSAIRNTQNRYITIKYKQKGVQNSPKGETFLFKKNNTISDLDFVSTQEDYKSYIEYRHLCEQYYHTLNYGTDILKQGNVKYLSIDKVRLIRNEIYAKKGYTFTDSTLQNYFENKDWYHRINNNEQIILNSIEQKNVAFLKQVEKRLKVKRLSLINQLKLLKQLVVTNSNKRLQTQFGFELDDDLKTTMSYIDLDDLNWHKNSGLYSITIDNGFVKKLIYLRIDLDEIVFSYNFMSNSDLIEDLDGDFTEYKSESEYSIWWNFKFKSGKIIFVDTDVAG